MAKGINKKNIEKLEAFVYAERNIRNNRNTGQPTPTSNA